MSIKNPHIIHFVKKIKEGWRKGENRYVCIGACGTTKEKSTCRWKNVTCRNCLKQKEKQENKNAKSKK